MNTLAVRHPKPRENIPMPNKLGVLLADDVARILTEEAQAANARRIFTKKLAPKVRDTADLLPDVTLRASTSPVDETIADLKADLTSWANTPITPDMNEAAIGELVEDLHRQIRRARQPLHGGHPGFDPDNPHVKAVQRTLDGLTALVETEWDVRKRPTVSRTTVWAYVNKSYPATPGTQGIPARLAANPIPAPKASEDHVREHGGEQARGRGRGIRPMWYASQEPELRDWYRSLPGPGAGGGRPWHKTKTTDN